MDPLLNQLINLGVLTETQGKWKLKTKTYKDYVGDIVTALGKLKAEKTIDPLIVLMGFLEINEKCSRSLKKLTGENFGKDQKRWKQWREQEK